MAARARQWKRKWIVPRKRCHGQSQCCCITVWLKSNPSRRRQASKRMLRHAVEAE